MKFIDYSTVHVKSGDGGPGHISFRKEKFVPKGGPDGGNGGKGGNVVFKADRHLSTLLDFRYKKDYLAEDGKPGQKKGCTGRDGKDIVIRIPCGTLIKYARTEEIIKDLTENGEEFIIAKGGKGGKGNKEFTTPTNQTPRYAQPGLPGQDFELILELKLIADVGIVGYPNVGKSTLISVISEAKPKIADYPFTTLVPNLGMVRIGDYQNYVIADIPGLIEGAAEGKGLGHQFLRHVDRCRVLLFMIDATSEDPKNDFDILMNELVKYNPEMNLKQKIVCFSKSDLIDEARTKEIQKIKFKKVTKKSVLISSVMHQNTDLLKKLLWEEISKEI